MSVFQTPWKLVGRSGNDFEQIVDADRNVLIEEIGFDLGMLIVKAVNSNQKLHNAAEEAERTMIQMYRAVNPAANTETGNRMADYDPAVLKLRAALAKATGVK